MMHVHTRCVQADEAERMRKRAGRFGGTVAPALVQLDDLDKKKQRLGRFGTAVSDLAVDVRVYYNTCTSVWL